MLRVTAMSLLIGFGVSFIAFEVSTVFLHRGLAHRAVTLKRPVTDRSTTSGGVPTQIGPAICNGWR
ncbi:MAG: hypothetical protein M3P52_02640 [Actinomycetota bacterium]|nr:hypothetical protein [Actinomycetota bacterium]